MSGASHPVIALAGNPNCGKTTLFNALTGGTQRIGNWPGVTVEKVEGKLKGSGHIRVVDLPGIYSFSASSEDEKAARDYLLSGEPTLAVNIVDASHLERNLYLTANLLEMDMPTIVVLNMMDLAEKEGIHINPDILQRSLGCPVIPLIATDKASTNNALKEIAAFCKTPQTPMVRPEYPNEVEEVLARWVTATKTRWNAVSILEGTLPLGHDIPLDEAAVLHERQRIEHVLKEDAEIIIADGRYGFVHSVTEHSIKRDINRRSISERIDQIVLNRFLGIPIFMVMMYLVFWLAVTVGSAFIEFFEVLFGTIFVDGFTHVLNILGSPDWLVSILAGGVGAGIQTVATFIPVVFFMFLALSLLEDSGYLARAAFVMDRFMRTLGLPGKAFVPMIVGFGCTVPAILATRTLENKRDRMMTIFMVPLMSCGARLPVYALFGAVLFGAHAGRIVFSLYVIGVLLAILTGLFLKHSLFRGEPSYFIMELPPYHTPRAQHILMHTWNRLRVFLLRAGKVIILAVIVLSFFNSLGTDGSFGNEDTDISVLTNAGKAITPVFSPMGITQDNWPATVGLFTGLFAKEAVVGTLNGLYGQIAAAQTAQEYALNEPDNDTFSLGEGLRESFSALAEGLKSIFISEDDEMLTDDPSERSVYTLMRSSFTPAAGYAYLLFVLVYFPCLAAFAAAVKEMGAFFGVLQAVYLTITAWSIAVLFYQIVEGGQILWMAAAALVVVGQFVLFRVVGSRSAAHR